MNKSKLHQLVVINSFKTVLEQLYDIAVQQHDITLLNSVIIIFSEYNGLMNNILIHKPTREELNQIRQSILGLIEELPDKDFNTKIATDKEEIKYKQRYGTQGFAYLQKSKNLKFFLIFLSISLISFVLYFLKYRYIDDRERAFNNLFTEYVNNNAQKDFASYNYQGRWQLNGEYIIRKDTTFIQKNWVYYTVGERAEVFLYCLDNKKLGGIEYIINSIYKVSVLDSKKVGLSIEVLKKYGKKIQSINVVFEDVLDLKGMKRVGDLIVHYKPAPFDYYIAFNSHRVLVDTLLDRYRANARRECNLIVDSSSMKITFDCPPSGNRSIGYTKNLKIAE